MRRDGFGLGFVVGARGWLVCLACLCVCVSGHRAECALDDSQQAVLGQAQTALKNAGADLDAARSSAGTAANPAKGSRVKLTKMRLDSARQRLDQAAEALGGLPAEDEAVVAAQARYNEVLAGVEQVEAIINPPAAPEPAPEAPSDKAEKDKPAPSEPAKAEDAKEEGPAPEPAAPAQPAPAKLHYTQEKLVKDANWYVRETNSYADKAAKVVAALDAEGPKPVHSEVRQALEAVKTGLTKHALAVGYIEQLPADHPQVKPTADAVKQAGDRIGALGSRLEAADAELDKLTNMVHYPNYQQDYALLGDFARRYYDFNMAMQQPEALAHVIKEDGQVMSEVQRIAKTYLPLVEQRTAEGDKLESLFNHFQQKRNQFAAQLIEYKKNLPAAFESDIQEGLSLAQQGVNEQKPMFFGKDSGIEQRFGWAEQKLLVFKAFGEEEAKPYVDRLAEARKQVNQMAKALEGKIIQENTLPPNRYQGADRAELVELAKEAWAKQQPDAEVLTACIPSQAWERSTRWEWFSGAFHKVDKSHVQVQLIVKHDDKLAVIRPVNLYKNHLKGDSINAWPMDAVEDELIPQRYLLLEKVE